MITVTLPAALAALFPGSPARLELDAVSVGELLDGLNARWPGMADRLRDSRPAVRQHISIFVDGKRACLDTRLKPGADVHILAKISGG